MESSSLIATSPEVRDREVFIGVVRAETKLRWDEEQMGGEKMEIAQEMPFFLMNRAMKEGTVYFGVERVVFFVCLFV